MLIKIDSIHFAGARIYWQISVCTWMNPVCMFDCVVENLKIVVTNISGVSFFIFIFGDFIFSVCKNPYKFAYQHYKGF